MSPRRAATRPRRLPPRSILSLAATSTSFAGAQDVSPALRQRAVETCGGDALRLCPEAMAGVSAAVPCLAGKRPQLTRACRAVDDPVARRPRE